MAIDEVGGYFHVWKLGGGVIQYEAGGTQKQANRYLLTYLPQLMALRYPVSPTAQSNEEEKKMKSECSVGLGKEMRAVSISEQSNESDLRHSRNEGFQRPAIKFFRKPFRRLQRGEEGRHSNIERYEYCMAFCN